MKKVAFVVLGLIAIGVFAPALAVTKGVALQDNKYVPNSITITVGSTIKWTDNGSNPHSVTARPGQTETFDSSPGCSADTTKCLKHGNTFQFTFSHTGTFTYYCQIHGAPSGACSMCGTVVVKAASTPAPTAVKTLPPKTATPAPHRTTTPTTAPVSHTTPKPGTSATPKPSASPTATPVDTLGAFVTPIGSPASSAIAFGSTSKGSSRGPLIGLAIGTVAVAIGAGLLFWFRTRGSAP